jgi:hypothetical protein
MSVFGLAAHIAHGLVQQNSDLCVLVAFGAWVNFHAVCGAYFHAHFGWPTVDQDPALLNPRVGFAARTQTEFGHAFVQAGEVGGGVWHIRPHV